MSLCNIAISQFTTKNKVIFMLQYNKNLMCGLLISVDIPLKKGVWSRKKSLFWIYFITKTSAEIGTF